ncbi:hypothetical protein VCUG_02191 [Vavraia culicis subsp. floridensis]|uniref:Uncharacterized protein n=1 Tax=Vavraia culicis (isolate floridensis) TaxID=948595 RepID=L2GSN4_VAVCU|nr:uncharacterized protein VCUG_02191 [Vavraia culicis subsp. floridensis]ELA46303.2 hypothetical protein VCUG_02191 [Vavraia culicis subsp. floridensis]
MEYYNIDTLLALTNRVTVTFTPPTTLLIPATKTTSTLTTSALPLYQVLFFLKNGHCVLYGPLVPVNIMNDLMACPVLVNLNKLYRHMYRLVGIIGEEGWTDIFRIRMGMLSRLLFAENFCEDDLLICDENEREIVRMGIVRFKKFA